MNKTALTEMSSNNSLESLGELAQRLSTAKISESVFSHNEAGKILKEYRVISSYTAASGNECREITVKESGHSDTEADLICGSVERRWYWPRDVISE